MRISVAIPTKDRPRQLQRAVESVMAQSHTELEVIIFDNGDMSSRWAIQPWLTCEDRVRYHRGTASGPAQAFDRAMRLCSGDIWTPMGDDDVLPPNALATAAQHFPHPEQSSWLVGVTDIVDEQGNLLTQRGEPFSQERMENWYIFGGAVYFLPDFYRRHGGYDEEYDGAADYELYWRMAKDEEPAFLNAVMYTYIDHPGADTRVNADRQRAQDAKIKARHGRR